MALETIKKLLANYKHIDESLITRETTFESIGIDSLDTVDLVIDLEEAFHIIIERDETIETVFFVARPRYSFLSSSVSKEIALNNGDLSKFIPEAIINEVEEELNPLKKKTGGE